MDKEMIERCARAALTHSGNDNPSQAQLNIAKRTVYPIIKAMREPTEKMSEAGSDVGPDRSPDAYWGAMIDAITGAE